MNTSLEDRDAAETLGRRLQLALLGRLTVATIVLGGTLLFWSGSSPDSFTPRALSTLIAASYALSALGAVAVSRARTFLSRLGAAQIATDLALAGGVVYLTGGAQSGFTFLFGAIVLVTALVGSGRSATLVAAASVVLYVTIALGLTNGSLPGPPDQTPIDYAPEGGELATALLRNLVGLIVVGGLAASLGDRLQHTRTELERAHESAAGYAQLHEDVVRSLSSGLVTIDAEGRITTANPASANILRVNDDALVGQPIQRYIDVEDDPIERRESQGRRHDASAFTVGYTRVPLRTAEGAQAGWIIIFQDLTELTALRQKAEHANRLAVLGSLAAGLAHEIRNPLGSIAGSVELVRDGATLEAEDRGLLDSVLKETDRLNELVTTMLEVGRAGPATRARVPVAPIARDVIALAERGTTDIRFELVLEPPEGPAEDPTEDPTEGRTEGPTGGPREGRGEVHAVVDPQQIRQVLWNLVRNAVQFSPPHGVVRVRVHEAPLATTFEVSDMGPGVSAEDRERIFDMFFTKRRRGFGLGLALSKQIVDAHQGEIVALANEPRGSLFRVRIPHDAGQRTSEPRSLLRPMDGPTLDEPFEEPPALR